MTEVPNVSEGAKSGGIADVDPTGNEPEAVEAEAAEEAEEEQADERPDI